MTRILIPVALMLPLACSPVSFYREAGVGSDAGTGQDAGGADSTARDRPLGSWDAARRDGQLSWDAVGRDTSIGPRRDAGSVRDTWGVDLAAGDVRGRDSQAPPPGSQSCNVWTDCAPHYSDSNSGYECHAGFCVCDPANSMAGSCVSNAGLWIAQECYCQYNAGPLPSDDPSNPDCWWSWYQDSCEADYWVDTSYWDRQCYCCDEYGYDICDDIYVADGYWESGYCPAGWWEERCY